MVIHKESGIKKRCFVGYSWTYFFFGFFVPIFRGEISIGIFHLIFSIVTFGLFQLVMPFLYNKQASVRLLLNGWELNDSISLSKILSQFGIDVIDCSSGGIAGRPRFAANDDGSVLKSNLDRGLGFQVPYAYEIKKNSAIKTMAVGVIVDPKQAENILIEEQADLIAMGRELMYNPFWLLHAAQVLGVDPDFNLWPEQYRWGVNRRSKIEKFNNVK